MRPLHVRKEIDGFIADRLMEAMWRESLHLIDEDVATAEELDDAIRFGAGLRWSFMGNFLIYRIAGGEQGMRHFMAQFGPALKLPWTKLEAPELTDELLDKIVAQSDEQAGDALDPRAGAPARRLPDRGDAGPAGARLGCRAGPQALRRAGSTTRASASPTSTRST